VSQVLIAFARDDIAPGMTWQSVAHHPSTVLVTHVRIRMPPMLELVRLELGTQLLELHEPTVDAEPGDPVSWRLQKMTVWPARHGMKLTVHNPGSAAVPLEALLRALVLA
jgi:hypothetical protein